MKNNRFDVLDRLAPLFEAPEPSFEAFLRRRDRKRRNQRIGAGVVGIAVFVATVWVVTSGLSLDRTQTPVGPGPTETGPAVTGPTESSGPGVWLPPKGAEPSTPTKGKVVLKTVGTHPWHSIQVYEDGRVIWSQQIGFTGSYRTASTTGWLERRLTPEGVDLVRSGAIRLEDLDPPSHVPASVWEGEAQPYVPSRYVVCAAWSQETMRLLPQRTQDLLLGHMDKLAVYHTGEAVFSRLGRGVACPEMTIEEARALDRVFLEVGFERSETASGLVYDIKARDVSSIHVIPLLPGGVFSACCPG
jgi:hypothetical protein